MPRFSKANRHRMEALSKANLKKALIKSNKENVLSVSRPGLDSPSCSPEPEPERTRVENPKKSKKPSLSERLATINLELENSKAANSQLQDDLKEARISLESQQQQMTDNLQKLSDLRNDKDNLQRRLRLSQRQVKRAKDTNTRLRRESKSGSKQNRNASEMQEKLALTQRDLACARAEVFRSIAAADKCVAQIRLECARAISLARQEAADSITCSQQEVAAARLEASQILTDATRNSEELRGLLTSKASHASNLKEQLTVARARIYALEKRCQRHPAIIARAVAKAKRQPAVFRLLHKGVYTVQARAMARTLAECNTAPDKIGYVIRCIAKSMGITVVGKFSRRSVRRVQLEGGIASNLQIAHEIHQSPGFTASGDGTSHRHVNYESRHISLVAPDYESLSNSLPLKHCVRFIGVESSPDHRSQTQADGFVSRLSDIAEQYSDSPMARRHGHVLKVAHIAKKFKGMMSDHAADQKLESNILKEWKDKETKVSLGEDALLSKSLGELINILTDENNKKMAAVGGHEAWDALSPSEQSTRDAATLRDIHLRLGQDAYATLPDDERRELDLYIWAGCAMHKDMNSVTGGNASMMSWWKANDITPPILLANKDNAAVLQDVSKGAKSSTAAERALEVSTRGGVKATSLAGALFNHKDDKKGHQDTHRWRFKHSFPDTSNTRYHSHCDAAAELLLYLDEYVDFLEGIRARKTNSKFNHMEQNLYDALHDIPTLTELAVLALYAQAITDPYMKLVRGPGLEQLNALDLGPLHAEVKKHCQMLIDNPDLLPSEDASGKSSTLDGTEWANPKVINAIRERASTLPQLKPLLVAFLKGALETWERFTSEHVPGGVIDLATADERELAWMPATNDANEGALGSLRLHLRDKPSTALHLYNSQAMFKRNKTQAFMDLMFLDEDHTYIMKQARKIDSSKLESKRRADQVEHERKLEEMKKRKAAEKLRKLSEKKAQLAQVILALSDTEIMRLSVKQLDEQIDVHRECDKTVPPKSRSKNRDEKRDAVKKAAQNYKIRFPESKGLWLEDIGIISTEQVPEDVAMQEPDEDSDMED